MTTNEFKEKIESNADYLNNNNNINTLAHFMDDPYNFRFNETAYTWIIIKNEINNTDKIPIGQLDNINLPNEDNKFKRSREKSRNSKSNLHENSNNSVNNSLKEQSRELPPIKKNSIKNSNPIKNEIKDIDLTYVKSRGDSIKHIKNINDKTDIKEQSNHLSDINSINNIPEMNNYPANSILNRKDSISSISSKQSNRPRPRSGKSNSMRK